MRNLLLIVVVLFSIVGYSQRRVRVVKNTPSKNNEIHLNALSLIGAKRFDLLIEHVINEESSVGISFLTKIKDNENPDWNGRRYSITPYYRHYFSYQYASGFFMEAFTMFNMGNEYTIDEFLNKKIVSDTNQDYRDVAFGVSVGQKLVSRRGFVGTVYAGLGRNLFDINSPEVIGRAGVSFGFRF
jgi:hypothetical protein